MQIAEDGDAASGERVDERQEASASTSVGVDACDRRRRVTVVAGSSDGVDQVVRDRGGAQRRRPFGAAAVAGAHEHAARADRLPGREVVPRSPTTNERARSRSRSAAASPHMPGCGLRQSHACRYCSTPRPDGADSSRSRRRARRRPRAAPAMRRCAASTNASSNMPRAMPAWLVTTTTAKPARFSSRTASTLNGKNTSTIEPIEIAALLR